MITKDEYTLTRRLFQGEIKVEDWVDELESILRSLEDMVDSTPENEPKQLYQTMTRAEHRWMDAKRHFENYEMMNAVWCHIAIREYINQLQQDER